MATTVTNSTIAAFGTAITVTSNAAESTVNGTAEVFTITPTKGTQSLLIVCGGTGEAAANIEASIAAGDLWAGKAITFTVTEKVETAIQVETAYVMQDDGTISLTLDPGASDSLKTTHAAFVKVYELR